MRLPERISLPRARVSRPPSRRALWWSASFVLTFALGVVLLGRFAYVSLVITPREEFIAVSSTLHASSKSTGRDVSLEVITVEDTMIREKEVEKRKKVEERAKGRVVIFNAYTAQPQVLVQGTRLEAPNGNIYRIPEQILVPAAKVENGKIIPQGIEVTVIADKPGAEYNLGLSDFTIPGFKGSARFEKFYGRSKTEITGGLEGEAQIVSEEEVKGLVSAAEEDLRDTLRQKVSRDLPKGVFLPEGAEEFESHVEEVVPPVNSQATMMKVRVKGTFSAFALKEKDIARFLAPLYLGGEIQEEVQLLNRGGLSFEILNKNFDEKTLVAKVKGRAHFVWEFEEDSLKKDLISERGEDRKEVFTRYPAITRAEIHFRPSWWRIFPKDPSRIRIEKIIKNENP